MLVSDAMTRTVVTIGPGATLRDAARRLATHSITAMPVVAQDGRVVGVLSEADVLRDTLVADQRSHLLVVPIRVHPAGTYVVDVMTTLPMVVAPETDLAEVARLMTDTAVKSLPVVDRGVLVGVVSRTDVIALLARSDDQVEAEVDELVRTSGKDWLVTVEDGVVTLDGPVNDSDERLARALASTVRGVVGLRLH
jgi:CBS domain-containing protein